MFKSWYLMYVLTKNLKTRLYSGPVVKWLIYHGMLFLSGEDSKEMSAAGQMDTILGVKGMSQVKHHNLHTKVKIHLYFTRRSTKLERVYVFLIFSILLGLLCIKWEKVKSRRGPTWHIFLIVILFN